MINEKANAVSAQTQAVAESVKAAPTSAPSVALLEKLERECKQLEKECKNASIN